MKKLVQTLTVSKAGTDAAIHETYNLQLDNNYRYCIGVALIDNNVNSISNSTNVQIGISDEDGILFDLVPIRVWEQSDSIDKNKLFRNCHFRAAGNNINVILKADELVSGDTAHFDIVFLLSENPGYESKGFQFKKITLSSLVQNVIEQFSVTLRHDFEKVLGIGMYCPGANEYEFFATIRDSKGTYLPALRGSLLKLDSDTPYRNRFFPVDMQASGQPLTIDIKNAETVASGDNVLFLVFECQRQLNPITYANSR